MASRKRSLSNDSDLSHLYKELDDALCPICMDHPHNGVILICSSHDKSCRPYICDTSYRHSNCLDRFKKMKDENADSLTETSLVLDSNQTSVMSGSLDLTVVTGHANNTQSRGSGGEQEGRTWGTLEFEDTNLEKSKEVLKLRCPLCRGEVLDWKVVEEARNYLNLKTRSCSHESCPFIGNYQELRKHARSVHPTVRPADVDPSRQRTWRRLENQREYNDIVTALRSAMPGAIVVGDYVIDGGDRDRHGGADNGDPLLSTLFLFQMLGPLEPGRDRRGNRSRLLPRHRRAAGTSSRRRYLWGENLLGRQDDDDDEDEDHEADLNGPPNRRQRRRLSRAESDEDQQ